MEKPKVIQKLLHKYHNHNHNHNTTDRTQSQSLRYLHTQTEIINGNVSVLCMSQNLVDDNMFIANMT